MSRYWSEVTSSQGTERRPLKLPAMECPKMEERQYDDGLKVKEGKHLAGAPESSDTKSKCLILWDISTYVHGTYILL